jgi:hypothetical protein
MRPLLGSGRVTPNVGLFRPASPDRPPRIPGLRRLDPILPLNPEDRASCRMAGRGISYGVSMIVRFLSCPAICRCWPQVSLNVLRSVTVTIGYYLAPSYYPGSVSTFELGDYYSSTRPRFSPNPLSILSGEGLDEARTRRIVAPVISSNW